MGFVDYATEGAVGIITINRPQALNALNSQVLDDLNTVLDNVNLEETRCLIITGAGEKSFVAGADIGEMSTLTKEEGKAFGKKGNDIFLKIETFRQPETGLGITPGFGGTQRLARLVGAGMAKQMVYSALNIKADEAYRIGLVNAVYPQAELMDQAKKLAGRIAMQAPIAVRAAKAAINEGIQTSISDGVRIEEEQFGSCFETEDQKEGMANFLRKKDDPNKVKHVAFKNK